jgi:hypothetical protein
MNHKRRMNEHFMVEEFIFFRGLHQTIQEQNLPKIIIFNDFNLLESGLDAGQRFFVRKEKSRRRGMVFSEL